VAVEAVSVDGLPMVMAQLQTSSRISPVNSRNDADAVLKITVKGLTSSGRISLKAQLINARGRVLWPVRSTNRTLIHDGEPADAVAQLVKNLLRDIQR